MHPDADVSTGNTTCMLVPTSHQSMASTSGETPLNPFALMMGVSLTEALLIQWIRDFLDSEEETMNWIQGILAARQKKSTWNEDDILLPDDQGEIEELPSSMASAASSSDGFEHVDDEDLHQFLESYFSADGNL